MTPHDLRKIGEKLFGKWGWQTKLAKVLRVDGSTARRWIAGTTSIPGPAIVALELLTLQQEAKTKRILSPPQKNTLPKQPNT